MEKVTVCFYKVFGGYVRYDNKIWYNCPGCSIDEKNKECQYYKPICIYVFTVIPEASSQQKQPQDIPKQEAEQ